MLFDPLYMLIMVVGMVLSLGASAMVKSRFNKGSKVAISSGMTGADVAAAILRDSNIHDVNIVETQGFLGDHYNPTNKTLALSHDVYHGRNASAAGVAAHEVGHAIQHAENYWPMWARSAIVPAANIGSMLGPWIIIAGIFLGAAQGATTGLFVAKLGVFLFGAATLFTLITVPVEYDASARAKKHLINMNIIKPGIEANTVSSVLGAAGLTYVAAAISSLMTLIYWAMRAGLLGGSDE